MSNDFDILVKDVLSGRKTPDPDLNRQIIVKAKEKGQMMNHSRIRKPFAAAACVCLLAAGSITAYAAYHYLSPAQVAEHVSDNGALAEAFEGEEAILINETQQSNGYDITLLGLVSGKNLELCVPEEISSSLSDIRTYAAIAIAKSDGTEMEYRNLCISPLINGVDWFVANNATMDVSLTWFKQDGVVYELVECDNLQVFADRGVQLGVVDDFGNEGSAFYMDTQSGEYRRNADYEGTNALFTLPLDKSKADEKEAEAYINALEHNEENAREGAENEVEKTASALDANMVQMSEFIDTITMDNIDDHFIRDEETVLTARPDENGWIDFGSRYNKEEDYLVEGGRGYISYWIDDAEDFRITSFGISGMGDEKDTGILEMSKVQISVIVRNDDGSFTEATYRGKEGLFSIPDRTWR
ncbi:MAG: hypothetical protein J1E64_11450 [Acetatifactor sp.]|nr:hypothetical protein [Acetatifactor sp.]